MQSLTGPQKELFEELLRFGFTSAKMAARYFCLNGEQFVKQEEIGVHFGYTRENQSAQNSVSRRVNAVLHYLDRDLQVSMDALRIARVIVAEVERFRALYKEQKMMRALLDRLGIKQLPEGMPMAKLPVLEALLLAKNTGRLDRFKNEAPLKHRVLTLRYGLVDDKWHTLQAVHEIVGYTRGYMYLLEVSGLQELGIDIH